MYLDIHLHLYHLEDWFCFWSSLTGYWDAKWSDWRTNRDISRFAGMFTFLMPYLNIEWILIVHQLKRCNTFVEILFTRKILCIKFETKIHRIHKDPWKHATLLKISRKIPTNIAHKSKNTFFSHFKNILIIFIFYFI